MVRLVFRPYTQIRRTICTSVSLRASIRVSPDFTLFRHRSPSFGSQQICSYSNLSVNTRSVDSAPVRVPTSAAQGRLYFHCASGFSTQILAYMLDSLVRVSRRVNKNHFVSIAKTHVVHPTQYSTRNPDTALLSQGTDQAGTGDPEGALCFLGPSHAICTKGNSCKHQSSKVLSDARQTDADPPSTTGLTHLR